MLRSAVLFGAMLAAGGAANAQLTTYSSEASFLAAAGGGLSLADFQGLGGNTYQTLSHAITPSVPAGVTFSSTGGSSTDLFVAPANFGGNAAIVTDSLFANFFGTPLLASFAPNVTAVGSDVIPFAFDGATGTITINVHEPGGGTQAFSVTPPQGQAGFFGVIAGGGLTIDNMTYTPPSGFTAGIDDLRFGAAAPANVPEPGSLALLLGLGTAAVPFGLRRRMAKR